MALSPGSGGGIKQGHPDLKIPAGTRPPAREETSPARLPAMARQYSDSTSPDPPRDGFTSRSRLHSLGSPGHKDPVVNIGTFSYLFAFLAFLALTILLITSWRGRRIGVWIVLASASSTLWAGASAAAATLAPPAFVMQMLELLRDAMWCMFLLQLLKPEYAAPAADEQGSGFFSSSEEGTGSAGRGGFPWQASFLVIFFLALSVVMLGPLAARNGFIPGALTRDLVLMVWVALAIFGLLMIEQLYRNSSVGQRWAIKYLCLGIGGIFAYDFYMFADALLFKHLDQQLWAARGAANGIAVPLIAISIARNPSWSLRIHVSRQVVFHSVTLIGAGVYLLVMAGTGYLLRLYGGSWGALLQATFLIGTGALLLVLLFSDRIRAKIRVLLSKHFFSFKYDYREEWLRFTQTLGEGEEPVPDRVVHAIAALVKSPGGILWARNDSGNFSMLAHWNMPPAQVEPGPATDSLLAFLESRQWIIDLDEYAAEPGLYETLDIPSWLSSIPDGWLVIPLLSKNRLIGVLLLKRSEIETSINWEDRDLLKMAGRQAASYLAQHLSDQALLQARQFEAFNRLSAYVIHDLKNILAQQALIVSNAEKHKDNPAFVDDVIRTIENSVERMTRLMEQMRSGMRGTVTTAVSLNELLPEVVGRRSAQKPVPLTTLPDEQVVVQADRDQLANVFAHIIQNAQEATDDDGSISVRLYRDAQQAVVEIEDTGSGMDADFIQNRLFRPFDSTKGLTGMGVGAFESREVIRGLGGDILVSSTPGEGSTFRITIPVNRSAPVAPDTTSEMEA